MAIKRFTITKDGPVTFQKGDKVFDAHAGPNEGDGLWVIVDRDVPDAPAYYPGMIGTATVTNSYGVSIPNQHGVWVKTGIELFFRLFEGKTGKTTWREKWVSNFVPDAGADERLLSMARERAEAAERARKAERRATAAERALRAVTDDLHLLRMSGGRDAEMTTALGATMQRWLTRTSGEDR